MLAYGGVRLWLRNGPAHAFWHGHAVDLLCLPVCVPWSLWLQQRCFGRSPGEPPTVREIVVHWLWLSLWFEGIGPLWPALAPGAVADLRDVLAYAIGGVVAAVVWRSPWRGRAAVGARAQLAAMTLVAWAVLACYRWAD